MRMCLVGVCLATGDWISHDNCHLVLDLLDVSQEKESP